MYTQFTMSIMVKHLLSIKPGEPLASEILEDFETYMKGFISLPLYVPGTAYAKAVKVRACKYICITLSLIICIAS